MGLDIMASSKIRPLRDCRHDGDCFTKHEVLLPLAPFLAQADGLERGCYEVGGERFQFCAGSYSAYSEWRRVLSLFAHDVGPAAIWESPTEFDAFVELINFSDCEGVFGPKTSAKLAKDFADYEDRAVKFAVAIGDEGGWWLDRYYHWKRAFELAADGGAVCFH